MALMNEPRQWAFVADMDHSGTVTISDVLLWGKWLYFYPGDGLVYLIMNTMPRFAAFFELSNATYGGLFSGVVSFLAWLFVLSILGAAARGE